ncbi:MAG TPA: glycoside hydrolase family 2 TIM barrel-domain containing protein [Clostridia bacterium]|nr:glycoside hydrolase family 2 TIM barrel-domain containing protein [Clostridia bacterium]
MVNKGNQTWTPITGDLMTDWVEEVSADEVLTEYPRPQMVREHWQSLNGLWDYAIGQVNGEVPRYEGKILVPFPIESSLSGVKSPLKPDEILWYRRNFKIPGSWKDKRILLHFGAADWKTGVWLNGHTIGEHTGGYYPFTFDITEHLRDGDNELSVSVWDPTNTFGQERGKQSLHPRGIFYTAVSGIWQTVWLEPVPDVYIKSHRLTPDLDKQLLNLRVETDGLIETTGSHGGLEYRATVYKNGNEIVSGGDNISNTLSLRIPEPRPWHPEDPFLYDIRIELILDNIVKDEAKGYFGMRKYSVGRDELGVRRLMVNNEPLFQNGILDQGYWPDGLYTAPTDEALKYDIEVAKLLGFNMIRKHAKAEPARWYYHCDRLGIIVWQDMISGGKNINIYLNGIIPMVAGGLTIKDDKYRRVGRQDPGNRQNYRKELKEMIDALYNFPSIGMWVPFNEAWGQFDAVEIADWIEDYDGTRWIDHASGWHDQGTGDIKSVHIYFRRLKMPKNIKDRAVVISEYGGYSYPIKGHIWRDGKEFGYKKFKSIDDFEDAYRDLSKSQVEPLRQTGLSAAVYTQLTDVETEVNGLITYDRKRIKLNFMDRG